LNTPRHFRSIRIRPIVHACVLVALATAACGKKGPPLPPYAKAPAAPPESSARRLGDRVEIRFTVPTVDMDGQRPAHLDRIEVWALTGQVTDPILFMKYATLVATVPVRRPPPPPPDVEEGKPAPPAPPPSTEPGLDQGQPGLVVDELTPDKLQPTVVPELEKAMARDEALRLRRIADQEPPRLTPPDLGKPIPPPLMRYYVVMGRNGGRKGALTQRLAVALRPAPPAPPKPTSTLAENYVELAWTAPPGLPRPVHKGTAIAPVTAAAPGVRVPPGPGIPQPPGGRPPGPRPAGAPPPADDDEATPRPEPVAPRPAVEPAPVPAAVPPPAPAAETAAPGTAATGPPAAPAVLNSRSLTGFPSAIVGYSIYEVAPPDQPAAAPLQPGAVPPLPRRATLAPVATMSWRDEKLAFGTVRCYVVRTVVTIGTAVESEPSPVACLSPTDTFPPKAPTSLAAVASQGAISLIWDANTEADLAGYIVLRGSASGATMRPLTSDPIKETTYRDTTVRAGSRYVYAVVAVDTATPPNVSSQSNRVEETAR
jgi:predicted small lipoprotein YifL